MLPFLQKQSFEIQRIIMYLLCMISLKLSGQQANESIGLVLTIQNVRTKTTFYNSIKFSKMQIILLHYFVT